MVAPVRTREDFTALSRSRARGRSGPIWVVHAPSGDAERPACRVAYAVSKKVGGAVVRNRVRRRLRHLVGERLAVLPESSVLVVRALPPSAGSSSAELALDLDRCLTRVTRVRVGGSS